MNETAFIAGNVLGLIIGNLFVYGVVEKDWNKGLCIGIGSSFIFIPLMHLFWYIGVIN